MNANNWPPVEQISSARDCRREGRLRGEARKATPCQARVVSLVRPCWNPRKPDGHDRKILRSIPKRSAKTSSCTSRNKTHAPLWFDQQYQPDEGNAKSFTPALNGWVQCKEVKSEAMPVSRAVKKKDTVGASVKKRWRAAAESAKETPARLPLRSLQRKRSCQLLRPKGCGGKGWLVAAVRGKEGAETAKPKRTTASTSESKKAVPPPPSAAKSTPSQPTKKPDVRLPPRRCRNLPPSRRVPC